MQHRILVIDPDEGFTGALAQDLSKQGIEATTVAEGKDGLAQAQNDRPSAIVLCVELGRMSGYTVCARLKKDNKLSEIPLVIVSGESKTQAQFAEHQTKKTRAEAYLAKPFSARELVSVLGKFIDVDQRPPVDTVSDLELPSSVKSAHAEASLTTQKMETPKPSSPPNGAPLASKKDLSTGDLSQSLAREDSGGELQWMAKLRQSITRRDEQISQLKRQLEGAAKIEQTAAEDKRRLSEKMERVAKERDESVKAHMSLQEKLTSTRLDLSEVKKAKDASDDRIKSQAAEITRLETDLSTARALIEDQKRKLTKLESDKKELEKKLEGLEASHGKELITLGEELRTAKSQLDAKVTTIRMRDEELAKQKANYEKRLASADEMLKKSAAAAEAKAAQHAKDLESRDEKEGTLQATIRELEKNLANADAEHEELMKSSSELHAKETNRIREEKEALAKQLQEEKDALGLQLKQDKARAIDKAKEVNAKLNAELKAKEAKAADLAKRVAHLEQQLGLTKREMDNKQRETADLQVKLEAAEQKAESASQDVEETQKAKEQLLEALGQVNKLVASAEEAVSSLPAPAKRE